MTLCITYLIDRGRASSTVKLYISALTTVLREVGIIIPDKSYEISALIRACKLKNDELFIRLPIQRGLLNMLLDKVWE